MRKGVEYRTEVLLRRLDRNLVIFAVRTEGYVLEEALSEDRPAVIVLGGGIYDLGCGQIGGKKEVW